MTEAKLSSLNSSQEKKSMLKKLAQPEGVQPQKGGRGSQPNKNINQRRPTRDKLTKQSQHGKKFYSLCRSIMTSAKGIITHGQVK